MNRRRPRRQEAQLGFEALSIEGGLLSPEWLSRVAQLGAGAQSEPDYRVPKGLTLRDEIGRYWRIAQAHWTDFSTGRNANADPKGLAERLVTSLLQESFGFASLAPTAPVFLAERSYPIGHVALSGRVPVVIGPAGGGLDEPSPAFGDGARRRSAFGLVQEYLNALESAVWGIASDGVILRILRDNASLTRPAWIEASLERIFAEELYADFAVLWLLLHETRFGRQGQPATECALEAWRTAGREEGTRAREHLRRGVEDALVALGQGFLAHPENGALRADLHSGALSTKEYFGQLLRLVYRLIFLVTVEERGLLHPDGTSDVARALYADGYGVRRLRERSVRRSAHDRFSDLWQAIAIVFRVAATGEPRLGLPALTGLFANSQCPALDAAKLENRALLLAVFKLAWLREDGALARVNWRDMGPEELGSVYESLLELVPQISQDGRRFAFATGAETKGNARKSTGSYYTPDSLVQVLLDSALEPVIADTIARSPDDPVEALLGLSVVDPACGSGHFLLAAARRLAAHVARLKASGTPSAPEYRRALRQVVARSIYGVDLNPMAVELCKVSLWMEAVEPGLPLTFLDAHIQQGNALLGTTPALMAQGIPDAAWEPIEGDDKKVASALKKQNKRERAEMSLDFSKAPASTYARLAAGALAVDLENDATLDALEAKSRHWKELVASAAFEKQRFLSDLWCAAFVWNKDQGRMRDLAPTEGTFRALASDARRPPSELRREVERLTEQYAFFHWHLGFPQVFAKGGFDVVLGNPPWERVKLQEQEFFASRSPEIARAANAAVRKKLISGLQGENPPLWDDWCGALRKADGDSQFVRQSGRYPLCGTGDVNTYALFAEHNRALLAPTGSVGCLVPAGIATDDTTKLYFQSLLGSATLLSVFHFENEERLFLGVNNMFRFVLLTIGGKQRTTQAPQFVAFARSVAALADPGRKYRLTPQEIATINPNTLTLPTFMRRCDADINIAIYRHTGVFLREDTHDGNPWKLSVRTRLWHMAEDAEYFRTREQLAFEGWTRPGIDFERGRERMRPLYEAKMVHHFDHRFATYDGATRANRNKGTLPQSSDQQHADAHFATTPEYWVPAADVEGRLRVVWDGDWLLGWRDITNAHNERTVIAAVVPRTAVGHKLPLMFPGAEPPTIAGLYANLCSFVLDYAARQKVGSTSLTYFILKQLPILSPTTYGAKPGWLDRSRDMGVGEWVLSRVLELTYTAWDLEPFARDVGYDGPPFRWDPERRFLLRCELDAAFFHLYRLSRDDTDYVMDTFPIVRKNDEKSHGEYRTKRVILESYDAMADAARAGTAYATKLDPPPADPRVAHSPRAMR